MTLVSRSQLSINSESSFVEGVIGYLNGQSFRTNLTKDYTNGWNFAMLCDPVDGCPEMDMREIYSNQEPRAYQLYCDAHNAN